jgi:hypothetical protein
MGKSQEAVRLYSFSDADLVQSSRVMQGLFVEEKPAFISFDAKYADPFAENWLAKIDGIGEVVEDSIHVGQLTEATKKVMNKMEECKLHYQTVRYFTEAAFPDNKQKWTQFGFNDYDDARKSETKMVKFLGILHKTSITYKTQLLAAGLTQANIDKIETLQEELTGADYEQEILKKKRPELTQERIVKLNECFEMMQRVSRAAKIIFANNYAKYNQYLMPNEASEKKVVPATPAQPNS